MTVFLDPNQRIGGAFGALAQRQQAPLNPARAPSWRDRLFGAHMMPIAGALMTGRPEALQHGFTAAGLIKQDEEERREDRARRNATIEWLKTNASPEIAGLAESNPAAAMQMYAAEKSRGARQPSSFQEQVDFFRANPEEYQAFKRAQSPSDFNYMGGIPKDHRLVPTEGGGYQMEVIPGSPTAREVEAAEAARTEQTGARDVAGDVVVAAAERARKAAKGRDFGSVGTTIVGAINPASDSAEVVRQANVLRDLASAEALNQMRRQSPTGGALGNVTERELALLSRQAGTLDPNSPNFERDLAEYELNLLKTIHGPEAGQRIFDQTRTTNFLKDKYGLE